MYGSAATRSPFRPQVCPTKLSSVSTPLPQNRRYCSLPASQAGCQTSYHVLSSGRHPRYGPRPSMPRCRTFRPSYRFPHSSTRTTTGAYTTTISSKSTPSSRTSTSTPSPGKTPALTNGYSNSVQTTSSSLSQAQETIFSHMHVNPRLGSTP